MAKVALTQANPLVGTWISLAKQVEGEIVTLEFSAAGQLIYTIHTREKQHIMLLTYYIDQGFIISNQSSHPREEKTAFSITADGRLILNHQGMVSEFASSEVFSEKFSF